MSSKNIKNYNGFFSFSFERTKENETKENIAYIAFSVTYIAFSHGRGTPRPYSYRAIGCLHCVLV